MVGTPNGRVVSEQAFIIGIGPMATTSLASVTRDSTSANAWVTKALAPIAAVVGGDDQLIAHRAELVFPKHQVAVAEPHDGDRAVAHLLVRAQLRINRRYAQAAAHQHHRARQFADLAGQPERPDEIQNRVSLAQRHHLKGGLADRLDDHRDGAARGIEVRYRQWDTLTVLVDAGHDEVARPRRPRHVGGRYFPQKCRWGRIVSYG